MKTFLKEKIRNLDVDVILIKIKHKLHFITIIFNLYLILKNHLSNHQYFLILFLYLLLLYCFHH